MLDIFFKLSQFLCVTYKDSFCLFFFNDSTRAFGDTYLLPIVCFSNPPTAINRQRLCKNIHYNYIIV